MRQSAANKGSHPSPLSNRSRAKPVRRHAPTPTRRYISPYSSWSDGHWFLGTVILAWLLLAGRPANAQSAVKPTTIAPPLNVQSSSDPSVHTIESSNLDADFSPGERTTNAPAELDEIYATHDGYLNSTGIDRTAGSSVKPFSQAVSSDGASARRCQYHALHGAHRRPESRIRHGL